MFALLRKSRLETAANEGIGPADQRAELALVAREVPELVSQLGPNHRPGAVGLCAIAFAAWSGSGRIRSSWSASTFGGPARGLHSAAMLVVGIVVLVVSIIVERVATIRSAQLVNAAGGDWQAREVRYAHEGGAPRWLSGLGLLSYFGIIGGVVLIVVAAV